MNEPVQVGIIGDFDPQSRYHLATNEALRQAGRSLSMEVNCVWLPTPSLDKAHPEVPWSSSTPCGAPPAVRTPAWRAR